jgi:hypothetical protein
MRTYAALAFASAFGLALAPAVGHAAPKQDEGNGPRAKAKPVCGAKMLPLNEGNSWTYEAVEAPPPADASEDQMRKSLVRITPTQPGTVTITVKSVDAKKGADTVITLEETTTVQPENADKKKPVTDTHTIETTITCNAKGKFEIDPQSFFFAGEPGGAYGLTVDSVERSRDTSLKLIKGGIGDQPWREDIVMHWTRVPTPGSNAKLGSGKLELERQFTPEQPEMVISKLGSWRAEKLALVTTGRVTLDTPKSPDDTKPMELPAAWLNTIWMAHDVGVVQVLNRFSQMYQLTAVTLK